MRSASSAAVTSIALAALVAVSAACGLDTAGSGSLAPAGSGGPAAPPTATGSTSPAPPPVSPSSPDDAGTTSPPPMPCSKEPCAARPIVFVHGFTGSNDDFHTMMASLVANDPRYDGYELSGTTDHAAWAPASVDRRRWLFAFDYYVKSKSDARGSYTAGPGRIGSDSSFTCASPAGKGHILPENGSASDYDASVTHEYSSDLAAFVASVRRATGAPKIDVVAHSMGGMILRSYLVYGGGTALVDRALLLASPVSGVSLVAFLEYFPLDHEGWMDTHEVAELDGGSLISQLQFMPCGAPSGYAPVPWGHLLLEYELGNPLTTDYYVMSGGNDYEVPYGTADHPLAVSHEVVPGVDHSGILRAPLTATRVTQLLGGSF